VVRIAANDLAAIADGPDVVRFCGKDSGAAHVGDLIFGIDAQHCVKVGEGAVDVPFVEVSEGTERVAVFIVRTFLDQLAEASNCGVEVSTVERLGATIDSRR